MQQRIGGTARRRAVLLRGAGLATTCAAIAAVPALGVNALGLKSATPTLKNGGVPVGLSVNTDGAWFVNSQGPGVGLIKALSDGTPTLISEDTSGLRFGDRPMDTAFDGANLWIALDGAKTIARRRADGSYTREGTLKGAARHITAGQQVTGGQSSTVVWFTEPGVDTIGRATLSGDAAVIKEYSPESLRGFAPDQIVGLPNGTAVVTSTSSPRVVRLTPGANDTLVTTDIQWPGNALPGGLAVDRNSTVWWTQPTGAKVWRAFPNSSVAVEATGLSGLVQPTAIAVDSGNGIWIADPGAKTIVRANANAQRVPGSVSVNAPSEIEVVGSGRNATVWAVDGGQILRGTLSKVSDAVVAVADTRLTIKRGKPIRLKVTASEQVNLQVTFTRNGKRCGVAQQLASAGPRLLSLTLPASCSVKGAAALRPNVYRLNLRATDLDGNVSAAPRVNLIVRASKRAQLAAAR